ncbi:MAG: hypothetical protein M9942_09020 [Microthrixaceae bacterium]|nr:hypothetical protein [Microthrixaceae bacterium]MCO5318564.1 hypothetical protein [Microthrixaceae bacterium]
MIPVLVLAQDDSTLFLGEDFFPWMVLAFGAAMVVGNVLALVRPPSDAGSRGPADASGAARTDRGGVEEPQRPPVGRSVVLIGLGLAAAVWGLASLLS